MVHYPCRNLFWESRYISAAILFPHQVIFSANFKLYNSSSWCKHSITLSSGEVQNGCSVQGLQTASFISRKVTLSPSDRATTGDSFQSSRRANRRAGGCCVCAHRNRCFCEHNPD
ncbi:hypothetical protein ILYODFUR_012163 [Ilyodon furcidens]|uniref:Uncharacterized protein n=1 Tax=Ilyodon furcidens TaxID=33524 RepID=A0ABV0UFD6_9TELE